MKQETPVTRKLTTLGIPHSLHVHEKPLRSLEQAAEERGLRHDQIVRSLLFRLEDHTYVLVLVAGPGKVSWPKLRKHLDVRRLTTAKDTEVSEITGYEPGAVSPLGMRHTLRILADHNLKAQEVLSIGAGIRNAGVILRREDLLRAIDVDFAEIVEA
jgi:Cys-tRNA(Pro)/Cys-tRNA(Cys) deacylase